MRQVPKGRLNPSVCGPIEDVRTIHCMQPSKARERTIQPEAEVTSPLTRLMLAHGVSNARPNGSVCDYLRRLCRRLFWTLVFARPIQERRGLASNPDVADFSSL